MAGLITNPQEESPAVSGIYEGMRGPHTRASGDNAQQVPRRQVGRPLEAVFEARLARPSQLAVAAGDETGTFNVERIGDRVIEHNHTPDY